jgi:hypothetical protein
VTTASPLTVREIMDRDLADEPQSVVRVYETSKLRTDFLEYVLTDQLAREFAKVLERVIDSARPSGGETDKVGVWVSGFFGSGKSHFAKLAGHVLSDTRVGSDSARDLFAHLLHSERASDERLRELLQQAKTYRLACQLVLFDIMAFHSAAADRNVGLTVLRAFYDSLGLSKVVAFAERELELQAAGKYAAFIELYQQKGGVSWEEDKNLASSSALVAECLAELMPDRFRTPELAHQSLELAMREAEGHLTIDGVVDRLLRWLDQLQREAGSAPQRLIFVADEVGAWAGRDRNRIEQIRSLADTLAGKAQGRIWLIATSQEQLSAVVQNAPIADARAAEELLQRLEARFRTNVHLESSEVGTVIEDRVLRKRPSAQPALIQLWTKHEQQLRDISEPPGLELGANYPRADREPFIRDYPFLPYQLQAAADTFGGMRGVKISSGARSMIGVAFDALRSLATRRLGDVVSWDQIFDSANRENEFADEQYLGGQGLEYLNSADRDVLGAPVARPTRLLKALWLAQQSTRIPRTPRNLARLLADRLDIDLLQLERDVNQTLESLQERNFVRREAATEQWKFLTQDEVTVEKIVKRLAEDIRQRDVREAVQKEYTTQLQGVFNGRITVGSSNTAFEYGLFLNANPVRNERAAVQLRVDIVAGGSEAQRIAEESATNLDGPEVRWVIEAMSRLEDRLRRAIAIERLESDEEYRRIATSRTKIEAAKLQAEADELRKDAASDVERALQSGSLYWGGNQADLEPSSNGARSARGGHSTAARAKVEEALRDRILACYFRFADGDRTFDTRNIEKLFTMPAGDRAGLDTGLGLFEPDGHVRGNDVLVEELSTFLKSSTKTSGQDVADHFGGVPYGWPPDLLRYAATGMFVDGKMSVRDRGGRRYEDPREPGARTLFGTAAFKTVRLEIEEEALTPDESGQARTLLTELGHPPADGGEVALKEATLALTNDLARRVGVLEKARAVGLPLPTAYDAIPTAVDSIDASASRVKVVRALLAHGHDLRNASSALTGLEDFERVHGFEQYRRSKQLLQAALQAGLTDDPTYGASVQNARDELEALETQRRVLDEWDGAYRNYRLELLDTFKAVYTPLRHELHKRSQEARQLITEMPEFKELSLGDRALVRVDFLGEGKPLQEVSLPELRGDEQLLQANVEYSIPHMRTALAALDNQVSQARARVIELYTAHQKHDGPGGEIVTWKPAQAFAGKRFTLPEEIDDAFDPERERLKALVREGKTIQVV